MKNTKTLLLSSILLFTSVLALNARTNTELSQDLKTFKPYKNNETQFHFKEKEKNINFENDSARESNKTKDDPIIGTIRFLDLFECKDMIYKRGIFIWLPENYSRDNGPYSVIYFHDAQNLFLPSKSFSGYDWKVDETITRLRANKEIKPCIVVGIPNSPARDNELNLSTRDGKAYCNFVINEVMPLIKKRFPVRQNREDHIVAGSSMGGLMSFQMAFEHPDKFGGAICMSSAFHTKLSDIIAKVNKSEHVPLNVKFYIDTGEFEIVEEEHMDENIVTLYEQMVELLKQKGYRENINLKSYFHKGAKHHEKYWAERLDIPLKFLLKK
jgi:predicted alpha/beta superfamily hydrolase